MFKPFAFNSPKLSGNSTPGSARKATYPITRYGAGEKSAEVCKLPSTPPRRVKEKRMLDRENQMLVVNTLCHYAEMTHAANSSAAAQQESAAIEAQRPSYLYRPTVTLDGDQWCALYGPDLQVGVAGFGDSPALAMEAFDRAWVTPITKVQAGEGGGNV